jgi:ABC-type multidrug transport system ATPase subunit/ABC-type multidrug transport system permease subunit
MPKTTSGAFPRGGALFFILLFNALLALAEMTAAFSSKPILLKHKSFSFYRPAAYAIAQTVVDVPLVAVQVVLFNTIIYWMGGLAPTASQFFISCLVIWLVTMTTYAYFRALSALCGTLDTASRFTGLSIQILVVYTGYLIPPGQMRVWFSWLRRANWIAYGFECLMANEFTGLEMDCVSPYLVPQGPGVTSRHQSCALAGSQPGRTTVDGARYIEQAFQYRRSHLWRNFGLLWVFFLFFLAVACVGMEIMKPNAGGGALTVFKRGQVPKKMEETIETGGRQEKHAGDDEEAPTTTGPVDLEKMTDSNGDSTATSTQQGQNDEAVMKQIAKNETVYTFRDVNYVIPFEKGRRQLLREVSGYVRPGRLTALMGASGAGKTTLLNALAQRINFGTVTGEFLVDGRPLPKSFQRATGFAEQMDIHEPTSTVREALRFSALLRQPREVPVEEKYAYCETILDLLEMRDIAGATIGHVGEGLDQEQRKRLTIGVELASKPELLLFLDEPTSGLDSGAAFNIVRFLRKLADAGQAILCTIHQPSAVLFEHFDELLLLKAGGRVVYHGNLGHDSQDLISYFQGNGARPCPPDANPAEYMLEVIGAGDPNYKGTDWADVWQDSKECRARGDELAEMVDRRRNVDQSRSLKDDREYAMPLAVQTRAVVNRAFVAYWVSFYLLNIASQFSIRH